MHSYNPSPKGAKAELKVIFWLYIIFEATLGYMRLHRKSEPKIEIHRIFHPTLTKYTYLAANRIFSKTDPIVGHEGNFNKYKKR